MLMRNAVSGRVVIYQNICSPPRRPGMLYRAASLGFLKFSPRFCCVDFYQVVRYKSSPDIISLRARRLLPSFPRFVGP